ncbi:MAG TPA: DnaJ domain-containing protein [Myxococcaceae bacterium]|nr:DnaJ domain-containing protein [Myxococcaceae bacterium]
MAAPPPKKPPTLVPPVITPVRAVPPVASIVPTIPRVAPLPLRPAPAAARPATGPDMTELDRLAASLDSMDYFELLHCDRGASPADIKRSFYKWSRTYHPDKFFQLQDKAVKERVHEVYKRITEAYFVLRDDRKRTKYLVDIASPERATKLRFTEAAEVENKQAKKKEIEEQIGTHPKGRQFFQTGMQDLDAGRFAGAERNFKMALTYEPQNAKYKEKLKEASDKIFLESRERGDQFKIK